MSNKLKFLKPVYTQMGIYELELNPKNHRKISKKGFDRLKKKIVENVYEPIKVWKKGNIVLSGNQRLSVMRSLVEDESYVIDKVDVAVYDVDERTAMFIQLADNEHDGSYDIEKLVDDWEDLESLDLLDLIDPKVVRKLDTKVTTNIDEPLMNEEVSDREFDEVMEVQNAEIYISKVPKNDVPIFYDAIQRVKKLGVKGEWKCLKVIFKAIENMTNDELKKSL